MPVDIYRATFTEVIEHFGKGSLQRQIVALRLKKIYDLANETGKMRGLSFMVLLLRLKKIRMM